MSLATALDEPARQALRDLRRDLVDRRRDDDRPPRDLYPLAQLNRRSNVVVRLREGQGADRAELDRAVRQLKKDLVNTGTARLLRHESRLYAYIKPSVRRRQKSLIARRRARKAAMRALRFEAREEARGRR